MGEESQACRVGVDADLLLEALDEAARELFRSIASQYERDLEEAESSGGILACSALPLVVDDIPTETCIGIGFYGEVTGEVVLRCNSAAAENLAKSLLRMEQGEELQVGDVEDSLAECANIIGGLMKTKALDPFGDYALGIPRIVTHPVDAEGDRAGCLLFSREQDMVTLEVWAKNLPPGKRDEQD